TMPTLPLTDTAEFSARNVPWTRKLPFTVSAQLFAAVVSSVPVNPVMSMPPIVVAAASVTVPVGFALKTATSVAAGVQLHGAPPEEFDQIGRASCRERVEMAVGAVAVRKKEYK